MKPDKHKAKRSAKHKKQHGLSRGKGEGKSGQAKEFERGNKPKAPPQQSTSPELVKPSFTLIENQTAIDKIFSKRKIESNWDRYSDFPVEEESVRSESLGADFQMLIDQSGGAASHYRMKDENWWEKNGQDEVEVEMSKMFLIDFGEMEERLLAIPLHKRLGISEEYFERDVLDRMNADAASHAEKIQSELDEMKSVDSGISDGGNNRVESDSVSIGGIHRNAAVSSEMRLQSDCQSVERACGERDASIDGPQHRKTDEALPAAPNKLLSSCPVVDSEAPGIQDSPHTLETSKCTPIVERISMMPEPSVSTNDTGCASRPERETVEDLEAILDDLLDD